MGFEPSNHKGGFLEYCLTELNDSKDQQEEEEETRNNNKLSFLNSFTFRSTKEGWKGHDEDFTHGYFCGMSVVV